MTRGLSGGQPSGEMAGKVVVVTGSTSGIGRAVAMGFGGLGASVVFNGRSRKRLAAALKSAKARGLSASAVCADVSSPDGARRLIEGAYRAFGKVDVLVNNAGLPGPPSAPFWGIKPAAWSETMTVNLTAAVLCSSAYVRRLRGGQEGGRIINVSSTAGARPYAGLAPYCASKFALAGLTGCQAADLEGTGVVVVCLELASHRTPMTRRRLSREDYESLPPPTDVVDFFAYAATGPAGLLHGRTLSELRFKIDREAEARINGPLATTPPWVPYMARYNAEPPVPPGALYIDFLENPCGPPPSSHDVLKGLGKAAVGRYPDPGLPSLRHALSECLGLPAECFTFGNGSTELVERILRTFTRPGDRVVSTDPTWFVFERFCRVHGVELFQAPYGIDRQKKTGRLDFDGMLAAIDSRVRLVYLVNPNNPLGTAIGEGEFLRFLDRLPPHLPVVVDEAYIEYCERSDILRLSRIVKDSERPLFGIRTFSKFFGLAGMRVGYAYSTPAMTRLIARLALPFSISGASEAAAAAALADASHAERTRLAARRGRGRIYKALSEMGVFALSSEANFVMAEIPGEPARIYDALLEKGIFLPEVFWSGFMQLPVSLEEENGRYLNVLARLIGGEDG